MRRRIVDSPGCLVCGYMRRVRFSSAILLRLRAPYHSSASQRSIVAPIKTSGCPLRHLRLVEAPDVGLLVLVPVLEFELLAL